MEIYIFFIFKIIKNKNKEINIVKNYNKDLFIYLLIIFIFIIFNKQDFNKYQDLYFICFRNDTFFFNKRCNF